MNKMKKSVVAAGLAAGLLGGGAAGTILGTAGISGAQETTTTQAEADGTTPAAPADGSERPDPSAHHAEAIAPLVADGTITQAQADAVIAALDAAAPQGGPGGGRGGEHGRGGGPGGEAAASALGITVDELRTALDDGQTIAQIAESRGVDVQTVIDAMVADRTTRLAEKVAAGELTQEEADQKLADATARITDEVNNGRPEGGPGGPGGEAPADAPSAEEAPAN